MRESTGASTVGILVVSKQAIGLFHRVICQSGSAFNPLTLITDTYDNSRQLASDLRCPIDKSRRMIECLRSRDPN